MSSSTSGMTGTSSAYDPSRHDNQIVALYDTDRDARSARDTLVSSGVPESAVQVIARGGTGTMGTGTAATGTGGDGEGGIWGAVRSLFVPDEERSSYTHAIGQGHAMLVVTPTGSMDRDTVIHALERTNPIDFDAKVQEWNASGYDHTSAHPDYLASTQATQGGSAMAGGAMAGGAMGMGMASTAASDAGYDTRLGTAATQPQAASATSIPAAPPAATARTGAVRDDDTIQVIDEQLRVGKREVAAGAIRVRSYIVERPVEEQVRLREEHVSIERHPVDRPAGNASFQERVIEARATSEEAVVSKEARVVEEIGIRKDATERTETVRDTVRHTEVEVEDGTTANVKGAAADVKGTTGIPPRR